MRIKILVVDDEVILESLMEQRFRRRIEAGDYLFRYATSGQEALAIMGEEPDLDVILLDINMPDLDGLTVLALVADLLPITRTVMVSAYGDLQNVRLAMNRGAFDFVMKPIDFQDLEATIDKTAQHVSQLRESVRIKTSADLKARFFDNITHEFRTPLSMIIAPADTLLQHLPYEETTHRNLTTIRRNADQLLHLINQLLDLAKLESDSLPINESPGDIVAFVAQVVESFQPMARQKQLNLTFSASVDKQDAVFDADKWEKILSNLLSNALKFTPEQGRITVDCQIIQEQAVLRVRDTGIGISANHLPYIFDRFYQLDTSFTRAYEGSGIGLALAYELTLLLEGTLTVDSVPNEGTTFMVKLPVHSLGESRQAINIPAKPPKMATLIGALAIQPTDAPDESLPLVLIVEDNLELLAFIAESLGADYRVLTASDGRRGLDIAQRELPDVVISDVMMPMMDGYQLTRHLKTYPATDHIAVLLLTALSGTNNRLEGLSQGADDYLTKPFNLDELRFRLHNMVTRQQKLRDHYQQQFQVKVSPNQSIVTKTADQGAVTQESFLLKLTGIIERHLDETDFRAESLADEVAMSMRTLTRKLTMLAGISPARLIRTYRLQRATDLLRAGYSVTDAAYQVGFENPSYFATAFKDYYQQTPTDYINGN